jgi:REP element-mobilizing transposase RayT
MKFNPLTHHRRSIRLRGYDYAQAGAYFITVCTHNREYLFGQITDDGLIQLNVFGRLVEIEWLRTAIIRPYVELDAYVVMPNHFHAILAITEDGSSKKPAPSAASETRPTGTTRASVGAIMQQFKSIVAKGINRLRDTPGATVWQRNYYDEIIRDESHLNRVRQYIASNPANWAQDNENLWS